MPQSMNMKITAAGMSELLAQQANGLSVSLTHIAIGTGSYTPNGLETALSAEFLRGAIGAVAPAGDFGKTLSATLDGANEGDIKEIGVFTSTGTLFCLWSEPGLSRGSKVNGIPYVIQFTLNLQSLPAGSVTVQAGSPNVTFNIGDAGNYRFTAFYGFQANPPISPATGDAYIVDANPTGVFVGHEHHFAEYVGGSQGWVFKNPMLASIARRADGVFFERTTTGWQVWSPVPSNIALIPDLASRGLMGAAAQISDWNAAEATGFYWMLPTGANAPVSGQYSMGIVETHTGDWVTQTVHCFVNDSPNDTTIWRRSQDNNTWNNWYRLRLSEAEQDTRYVLKAGDTSTGNQAAPAFVTLPITNMSTIFQAVPNHTGLWHHDAGVLKGRHVQYRVGSQYFCDMLTMRQDGNYLHFIQQADNGFHAEGLPGQFNSVILSQHRVAGTAGITRTNTLDGISLNADEPWFDARYVRRPSSQWLNAQVFNFTGADQIFTVPSGITALQIKIWGAGGGDETNDSARPGGAGGFTKVILPVGQSYLLKAGTQLRVMVGQGGAAYQVLTPPAFYYGFASKSCYGEGIEGAGGGLSGVFFNGNAAINENDRLRALAIAGGGGGGCNAPTFSRVVAGSSGNSNISHAYSMRGNYAIDVDLASDPESASAGPLLMGGGCGGGYSGGFMGDVGRIASLYYETGNNPYGNGGSGFIHQLAADGDILSTANGAFAPPQASDPDYISLIGTGAHSASPVAASGYRGGHGLVVFRW